MNGKKELWVLLASFVLPIALGTAFFFLNPGAFTTNTVNYGKFVNPVIATQEQDLVFSNNEQRSINGLWTLVYKTKLCDDLCISSLNDMKTIRILMNENMRRIQRLLLIPNETTDTKNLEVLVASPSNNLLSKLSKYPNNSIFLIDPIGNVMMYYDPLDINIKLIVKDLNRLFKYSRIG
jgi:hypothetical protein